MAEQLVPARHAVPPLGHEEAAAMAATELQGFLAVVETLGDEDWERPTDCTLWNVRQVLAHVTGAAAGWANLSYLFGRTGNPAVQRPYRARGMSVLDAINQIQVDDRADRTPSELIDELLRVGPRAIDTRRRVPGLLRALRLPMPELGLRPLAYLTDAIYTRDMWAHRLDICRVTGRTMHLTPAHDGRLTALIVADLDERLRGRLDRAVTLQLDGPAGGTWVLGRGTPVASIRLDALDFHRIAAGRIEAAEVPADLAGDQNFVRRALGLVVVPY